MKSKLILLYLLAIAGISLIIYNLFLLISYVPQGFHSDIYQQLPVHFWLFFIAAYLIGCILALNREYPEFKMIGIVIIVLGFIVFFFIYNQLGYYVDDRSDDLTYLGEISSILWTGHFSILDIYPAILMFYAQVSAISGIPAPTLSTLLPCFFSLIFIIGIFMFSKSTIKIKGLLYIIIPASCIFYLHQMQFSIAPHVSYFTFVPIILYLLFHYSIDKENRYSWSLILLPITWLMPFMHPFLIIVASYIFILLLIRNLFSKEKFYSVINMFLMLLVAWFTWAIRSHGILEDLNQSYIAFVTGMNENVLSKGMTYLNKAITWTTPEDYWRTIILMFGRYFLPTIIILIALIMILFNKKLDILVKRTYLLYSSLFLLFGLLDAFMFINPIVAHTVIRMTALNFFIYFLIPLFAMALYILFLRKGTNTGIIMAASILTMTMATSVYGALPSAWTYTPNNGVAVNEVVGMNWLFMHKNQQPGIAVHDNQTMYRYCDLFYGWSEKELRTDVPEIRIPDHFGYINSQENMYQNFYVVILTYDERLYTDIWKYKNTEYMQFLPEDFARFKNTPDFNHIYSSLNIDLYKQ